MWWPICAIGADGAVNRTFQRFQLDNLGLYQILTADLWSPWITLSPHNLMCWSMTIQKKTAVPLSPRALSGLMLCSSMIRRTHRLRCRAGSLHDRLLLESYRHVDLGTIKLVSANLILHYAVDWFGSILCCIHCHYFMRLVLGMFFYILLL